MLACGTGRPDDEDDEDDNRMNADMTAQLHFGGGFIRKDTPTAAPGGGGDDNEQGDPGRRRSKKEARSLVVTMICLKSAMALHALSIHWRQRFREQQAQNLMLSMQPGAGAAQEGLVRSRKHNHRLESFGACVSPCTPYGWGWVVQRITDASHARLCDLVSSHGVITTASGRRSWRR